MAIFREAGTGLFSLFDAANSLDVNQNRSVVRAQIVTKLKDYTGPIHEFITPETSLEDETYPVRHDRRCKVRILDPNMAHEKLLSFWGNESTATNTEADRLAETLLPTMVIPQESHETNLQPKDIVFVRLRPGDNNMTYNLQYCDFESIDILWPSAPSCNEVCHLTLEELYWQGPEDVIYAPEPVEFNLLECAAKYDEEGANIWHHKRSNNYIATLNEAYQPYIKCFIYECSQNNYEIYINSANRTFAKQASMRADWDRGCRKECGLAARPAPAGSSYHNFGLAIDFNPVKNMGLDRTASSKQEWLSGRRDSKAEWEASAAIQIGKKIGLRYGGDFSPPDLVHFDAGTIVGNTKPASELKKVADAAGIEGNQLDMASYIEAAAV